MSVKITGLILCGSCNATGHILNEAGIVIDICRDCAGRGMEAVVDWGDEIPYRPMQTCFEMEMEINRP